MSSVEYLKEFVNERLTAAAEEIFRVFGKTIVLQYEEEIDRLRRLLDTDSKTDKRLQWAELPQQHVCKEEEVLADQQLCVQERNSSLDQEDPEPPQIKEEQEEPCSSQEGEQHVLKQETDVFMWIPAYEESDHSEPEPNRDHQLLSHSSHVAESQDQTRGKNEDSTRDAKPESKKRHHKSSRRSNNVYNSTRSEIRHNPYTGEKALHCDICGRDCKSKSNLQRHMRSHTGEKPYSCTTCGKDFRYGCSLKAHMISHTDEKPYLCKTCGKRYRQLSTLSNHMRIHTGEMPYSCKTCGEKFKVNNQLEHHMRGAHTGEKPYTCTTCGKAFRQSGQLTVHMKRVHSGEKK
ncbi:zinc finger protein 664-like isoform X4 [Micropterus salmoides]|uniref:zinc finger protein 664-like isoform X4 n=1 Tax=Micropterus salmoides TaxID=27706 RepID=UPI0018ED9DBF|nr:zinc finger protein 664-like isoform X4 [Micropterus salmoides]